MSAPSSGASSNYKNPPDLKAEPADHGIGRSRGGLSTKTHAIVDGKGRPLVILIGTGNGNDSPMFGPLMASLYVPRAGGGPPRTRPDAVLGDKAYSARAHRAHLRGRRITCVIPEPDDQLANRRRKGSAGGRPVTFDVDAYRGRNVVERAFNRFKNCGPSPPATTSRPSTTAPESSSPPSCSGYTNRETRPRWIDGDHHGACCRKTVVLGGGDEVLIHRTRTGVGYARGAGRNR